MRTLRRSPQLNFSSFSSLNLPPCLMNRCSCKKRISSGSSHRVLLSGLSINREAVKTPTRTVNMPSSRKIHRHPLYPPVPSNLAIPAARRPEKAPESALVQ